MKTEKKFSLFVDGVKIKEYKTKKSALNKYNKILDSQQMQHIKTMKIIIKKK